MWRDEKSIDHAELTKVDRLKELITFEQLIMSKKQHSIQFKYTETMFCWIYLNKMRALVEVLHKIFSKTVS